LHARLASFSLGGMKPLFSLLLTALALTSCVQNKARLDDRLEERKLAAFELKQSERQAYEIGERHGRTDAESGASRDAEGKIGGLEEPKKSAYLSGYEAGYTSATQAQATEARERKAELQPEQAAAHNAGFEAGLTDKLGRKMRDPEAHGARFDAKTKESFFSGYDEGYNSEG
jgi:hypothetical protein